MTKRGKVLRDTSAGPGLLAWRDSFTILDTVPSVIFSMSNIFHGSAPTMKRSANISSGRKFLHS